jgi:hypothetical protein
MTADLAHRWEWGSPDHFQKRDESYSGVEIHRPAGFRPKIRGHLSDQGKIPVYSRHILSSRTFNACLR